LRFEQILAYVSGWFRVILVGTLVARCLRLTDSILLAHELGFCVEVGDFRLTGGGPARQPSLWLSVTGGVGMVQATHISRSSMGEETGRVGISCTELSGRSAHGICIVGD
jgi:hypothetical protein